MATITLRKKKMGDGRLSLYLDIYEKGKRKCEYLGIHLLPETNNRAKTKNKELLKQAESMLAKRILEVQDTSFEVSTRKGGLLLLPMFDEFRKGRNSSIYLTLSNYLRDVCKQGMRITQIDALWVQKFVNHLQNKKRKKKGYKEGEKEEEKNLSENTVAEYISLFRVFWRWCVKKGFVSGNPFEELSLDTYKPVREYLTIEELQQLIKTPTKWRVRNIFLFSCFTGLRWSDIRNLRWGDVEQMSGRTRIRFRQQKTGEYEYMDLNSQAIGLMGEPKSDEMCVFNCGAPATNYMNLQLADWVKAAGIKKHITFHCARHTFATMLLTMDADIYVVSKLLGHTDVATTQIYAKIVDKKKQQAVDSIPQLL